VRRAPVWTLVALAAALLVSGCGGTTTVTTTVKTTVPSGTAKTGVGPPADTVQFGYLKSLKRKGSGYELRFDPALLLSGETANVAAAEDGAVEPGQPVPNDHYIVDEGHRQFTYLVPPTARVTVLKNGVQGTPITVAQLARLVEGENPFPRPLFEPISSGFWLQAHIDTVRALDQQYRP
jgi:hypothetical protein